MVDIPKPVAPPPTPPAACDDAIVTAVSELLEPAASLAKPRSLTQFKANVRRLSNKRCDDNKDTDVDADADADTAVVVVRRKPEVEGLELVLTLVCVFSM